MKTTEHLGHVDRYSRNALDAADRWKWPAAVAWLRMARQALAAAVAAGLDGDDLYRAHELAERLERIGTLLVQVVAPVPANEEQIDVRLMLADEAFEVGDVAYLDTVVPELADLGETASTETRERIRSLQTRVARIGRA